MSRLVKLVVAAGLMINISSFAYAEGFITDVTVADFSAKITGTTDCSEGTDVAIEVIRPGKDIFSVVKDSEATDETSLNSAVVLADETEVDAENEFEYICYFDKNEKSGTYTLRVQVYGEAEVREKTFIFENTERFKKASELLKNSSESNLVKVFEEYATDIDIEAGEEYILFSEKEKEYVLSAISEKDDIKTEFITSVGDIKKVHEVKAFEKSDLKEYVEKGDVVGVDVALIGEYSKLSSVKKDFFIAELHKRLENVEVPSDVNSEFSDAITEAKKPSSTGGPGGGGGSSSKGNSIVNSMTVIGGNNLNLNQDTLYVIDVPENEGFIDLDQTPWAKEAIETLFDNGIINGRSENEFCPTETVKREEFLKMVIESLNLVGISEEEKSFSDVNKDAWYSHYVDTGVGCGIINGISENEFGIGMKITRQDMATILYRAIKYSEIKLNSIREIDFNDESDIAEYAGEAVKALAAAKVINGMENGSFMPQKTATRAEAAVILYNLLYR